MARPNKKVSSDEKLSRRRVKLYVPDLPIVYKTNKIYQLVYSIEVKMQKDPLYISIKDYLFLITELEKCHEELIKRGLNRADGRVKARMEQKRLDQSGNKNNPAGVGEQKSSSVDNGVPAVNPFA